MTLSSTTNRVSYTGDGTTTAFAFSYYFFSTADLVVIRKNADLTETLFVLGTDYTITATQVDGVYPSGGTINTTVSPAVGTSLVIIRSPAEVQDLHMVLNGTIPVDQLEQRLDKVTALVQRLYDLSQRGVLLTDGTLGAWRPHINGTLTAGAMLLFDTDALGWAVGPTITQVSSDAADATAAAASAATAQAAATAASTSATASATSATASATSATASATSATSSATAAAASAASAASFAATVTGTSASPVSITAVGGITAANARFQKIYVTTASAVAISASPQFSAGNTDGDQMEIQYVGANSLSVANGTGLASNGTITMVADSITTWSWDASATKWVLKGYNFI